MSWRALILVMSIAAAVAAGCHGHDGRGTIATNPIRDERDPEADFLYHESAVPAATETETEPAEVEGETTIEIEVDEDAADAETTDTETTDTETTDDAEPDEQDQVGDVGLNGDRPSPGE